MQQRTTLPMAKKPTIATVAAHAGVAVSTVSRYLNGRYVSRPVRQRLSEVIAALGYSRSWTARNLSLGRKGCIGVVVDSSQDPWFVQLLSGIEEELAAHDTGLMLSSLELRGVYDPALVFSWIRDRRVDGLILAKSQRRERPLLRAAIDVQLPTVVVAPDEITTDVQVVRCNNIAGGEAVAAHLAALGHRRIAFAGLPEHSIDSRHRLRGLRSGLQARGIQLESRDVYTCASFTSEAGGRFAERFFERPLDVTALVLATDALAFGVMRVALQRGVRMPQDLSIVGFDGLPQGALFHPALTSVSQPMRDMGRVACSRLFDTLGGRMELTEFPMELIERESTAPAPGAHARKEIHLVQPTDRGASAGPSGES
jgi:LacI family transcriptional regulator, galactose operon repressor